MVKSVNLYVHVICRCLRHANQMRCFGLFIVVVDRSQDSSQLPAVDRAAYKLDNSELDDSFADDIRHAMLDSLPLLEERMAVVALDIAANKCFDQPAVVLALHLALASFVAENSALKMQTNKL